MLISQEDFHLFHSIDRRLYSILVADIWRDPVESMQIMALWLWLERAGFYNIIKRILALPAILINELADEAVICLSIINNAQSLFTSTAEASEIPLTHNLIKRDISLQFLQENRDLAIRGLAKVDREVCIRAFSDLMEEAIARNNAQRLVETQMLLQQTLSTRGGFGQFISCPENNNNNTTTTNNNNNNVVEAPNGNGVVPAEERTMFVTFSKGYPVGEWEVREFFNNLFGDNCIESFYMQDVKGNDEQALFARIVFFRAHFIHKILNGVAKAKFTINGKHVWMRKFVPKRPRILSLP